MEENKNALGLYFASANEIIGGHGADYLISATLCSYCAKFIDAEVEDKSSDYCGPFCEICGGDGTP